mmetsp:Transcript_18074/g.28081  ORF Transcript_18074/g.28081 Transcript_18074/m.28081 type:complete len:337 (-) Transcript_18074:123-1133(-)
MGDTSTNLFSGVNLFWFLPANKSAPGYAEAAVAARSYSKAFGGKKQVQQMELFGQLGEVNHLISALLHFTAVIGVMSASAPGQTPAVVLVCEALAKTLHMPTIHHAFQQIYKKQHIWCHHVFALVHDALANFISQMMHFNQKNLAVSTGKVPAAALWSTLHYILSTLLLRLIDLGCMLLAKEGLVTLTADTTFAAAAPPRAATQRTTTVPPEKKQKFQVATTSAPAPAPVAAPAKARVRDLPNKQQLASRNLGYPWKLAGKNEQAAELDAAVAVWPCPHLCIKHALRSFLCPHGVDGRLQGLCVQHLGWHQVPSSDKKKIKDWQKKHSSVVELMVP